MLAIGLFTGIGMVVHQRRTEAASCETSGSCAVEGSCGCGPTVDESTARDAGCTLAAADMPARGGAFRALFAEGLLAREATPSTSLWTFRWSAELEARARTRAAAESGCCSFFAFDLERRGDELRWTTRVPPSGEAALAMLDRIAAEASSRPA